MFRNRNNPSDRPEATGGRIIEDDSPIFVGPFTKREFDYYTSLETKKKTSRSGKKENKLKYQPPTSKELFARMKDTLKMYKEEIDSKMVKRKPLMEMNENKSTVNSGNEVVKSDVLISQSLTSDNPAQLNNETRGSNDSNSSQLTYTLDDSDPQSISNVLNTTYDKTDEPEDVESKINTNQNFVNDTQKDTRISRKSWLKYRHISGDASNSELSYLNVNETTQVLDASKETPCMNKSILSPFSNLKLDDVRGSLNDLLMSPLIDTPVPEMIKDYLTPPVKAPRRSMSTGRVSRKSSFLKSEIFKNKSVAVTPRKMSSTLITELKAEHCLVAGSPRSSSTTPDVFRAGKNDMWKSRKQSVTLTASQIKPKSKLPQLKKTPGKYDSIKSPVASYIRQGVNIQSMSKLRHAACAFEHSDKKTQSETKRPTKIPQPLFHSNVKKKLDLKVNTSVSKNTSFRRE